MCIFEKDELRKKLFNYKEKKTNDETPTTNKTKNEQ